MTGAQAPVSIAGCNPGDVAVGGGFQNTAPGQNIDASQPVFTGTGPATGWQVSSGAPATAFAICATP
ncbi:hypothetical protein ABZ876_02095 [Streptomyces sp. NPDC046931]|uniref:hypothetical protein n=1 Tax=Streptomyces sp. NPDC046931 TaxID=3154806 RepID=UPI0033CEF75E